MTRNSTHPIDPFVLDIDAWTGASVQTLRVASHSIATLPSDSPANTFYDGRIKDPGKCARAIFDNISAAGKANTSRAFIELVNADGGLDAWINYGWGRQALLRSLPSLNASVSSATLLARYVVKGIETSDAFRTIRLVLADRLVELDVPLLTTRYAGTTIGPGPTAEGNVDLQGQIKPYLFGSCLNVPSKLVNQFNLLYQFSANAISSMVVYDGGAPLTPTVDSANLTALLAVTLVAGQYATCLAQGIVRLGGAPQFDVTGDVVEGSTLALRSASKVAQRMMAMVATIAPADIDAASFAALHSFNPAEVGIYIDTESNASDLIAQVLQSPGAQVVPSLTGVFQAFVLTEPSATVDATYTIREILNAGTAMQLADSPNQGDQGAPAYSVVLNWGRIWQTQQPGSLAGVVAPDRVALLGNQNQQVTAQDLTVKTAHPRAPQLTFDTLFTKLADAQAEANRRLALLKVRRDRLTIPTFESVGTIEMGRSVKVQMQRFGYSAGKNFLVLGREDDFRNKTKNLHLWG